jgi:RNA polymerase sigma-70 factor (ECF subfamily)
VRESDAWLAAFLEGLGRPCSQDREALRALLQRQIVAARQAWPKVRLDPVAFAAALAGKIEEGADVMRALGQLRVADLYLAIAAATDAPGAVAAFEEQLARVPIYVSRSGADAALIDEATQRLRVKLLVGHERSPARLHQYSGRGALESWICAAAIRVVRDLQRAGGRHADDAGALDVLAATDDPELAVLRARHQDEFRQALQETLVELTARQRSLLRLFFFERMTTIEIARQHGVNQSTASRWLSEARQAVLQGVKRHIAARLRVTALTLDSLLALMRSRLDVSFSRLLASDDGEARAGRRR